MNEPHTRVAPAPTLLGFWIYLMSDCLLFAAFFAAYAVLRGNTFGGPGAADLFSLPYAVLETLVLLTSSFTAGLATLFAVRGEKRRSLALLATTLMLGVAFLALEVREFARFVAAGHGPAASGFLSAYFALVGTHGLHVACGVLWLVVLLARALRRSGEGIELPRLALFSLFWHFLDIVWIFIFTIVYLASFI